MRARGHGRLWAALVAALAACAIAAPAARAEITGLVPNWPALLPAFPGLPATAVSPGFDICPDGKPSCPDGVVLEMYERWRPLTQACDHDAVFALTYLRTTEEFVRASRGNQDLFSDNPWVNHEDTVFAELYFRAYDAYHSGEPVPAAWKTAFDAADSPNVNAIGDLLLGMNAHINRDLPYTLAAVGIVKPGGESRKPDHDAVNAFLENVADPLQDELNTRYDPLFSFTDLEPSPLDEESVLNLVKGFRENAWRNAERIVSAQSTEELALVVALIEAEAEIGAQLIKTAMTVPGYGPSRDAVCAVGNPDPFTVEVLDEKIKPVLDRDALRVKVSSDGPARVDLSSTGFQRFFGGAPEKFTKASSSKLVNGNQVIRLPLSAKGRRMLKQGRRVTLEALLGAPGELEASAAGVLRRH